MIFMFLFYGDERVLASMSRDERNALVERHVTYNHEVLEKRATVLAVRALEPTHTAHTIRPRNGEMTVRRGPYAHASEALTGFYLVECRDLDEAIELATLYPMPEGVGCVEVRPAMQGWDYAPSVDTTASPEAVWRVYADVARWPQWQQGVSEATLDGPLRSGATGQLVRVDRPPARLRIAAVTEQERYTTEVEMAPGVLLRTEHLLEPLPGGGARIVHRGVVPRALLDAFGLEFAPALYAEMKQSLEALAKIAEGNGR